MTRLIFLSTTFAAVFVAACTSTEARRSGDACGVASSQSALGIDRAGADAFAAQRNAGGRPARVAGPTDVVTTGVDPARLNLIVDGDGTVRSLACG